jgi:hypothetical protein
VWELAYWGQGGWRRGGGTEFAVVDSARQRQTGVLATTAWRPRALGGACLSGRIDLAGTAAKDAAAPERRTAGSSARWRLGRLPERAQVPPDLFRLRHQGDEPKASGATGAAEHVDRKRPHHQLGPGPVPTVCRAVLDDLVRLTDAPRGWRVRSLGQDPRTQLARGGQQAGVPNRVEARRRHRCAEAREQRERIEVDRECPIGLTAGRLGPRSPAAAE